MGKKRQEVINLVSSSSSASSSSEEEEEEDESCYSENEASSESCSSDPSSNEDDDDDRDEEEEVIEEDEEEESDESEGDHLDCGLLAAQAPAPVSRKRERRPPTRLMNEQRLHDPAEFGIEDRSVAIDGRDKHAHNAKSAEARARRIKRRRARGQDDEEDEVASSDYGSDSDEEHAATDLPHERLGVLLARMTHRRVPGVTVDKAFWSMRDNPFRRRLKDVRKGLGNNSAAARAKFNELVRVILGNDRYAVYALSGSDYRMARHRNDNDEQAPLCQFCNVAGHHVTHFLRVPRLQVLAAATCIALVNAVAEFCVALCAEMHAYATAAGDADFDMARAMQNLENHMQAIMVANSLKNSAAHNGRVMVHD